ncbi:MAG: mitochondrial fission ELM1 family protein [Candidatus Omnitrophica bacterium]|nr:mitochondrial fission ELM1 family protein [Candidatus Omnitrophota bacterium]
MNFFKKMKIPAFSENIIKDYGVINEYNKGIAKFRHNLLLVERFGKKKIVIREKTTLIGGEVRHFQFDEQGARRLKDALDDALRRM